MTGDVPEVETHIEVCDLICVYNTTVLETEVGAGTAVTLTNDSFKVENDIAARLVENKLVTSIAVTITDVSVFKVDAGIVAEISTTNASEVESESEFAVEFNITDDIPVFVAEIEITLTDDAALIVGYVGVGVTITMVNDESIVDTEKGNSTELTSNENEPVCEAELVIVVAITTDVALVLETEVKTSVVLNMTGDASVIAVNLTDDVTLFEIEVRVEIAFNIKDDVSVVEEGVRVGVAITTTVGTSVFETKLCFAVLVNMTDTSEVESGIKAMANDALEVEN